MATVDKCIADDIIAGKYPEDGATRIVEYTNAWGAKAYGVTFGTQDIETYTRPTEFIQNPRIYWDALEERLKARGYDLDQLDKDSPYGS